MRSLSDRCVSGRIASRLFVTFLIFSAAVFAQADPGPRGGQPNSGPPYQGLNPNQQTYFQQALARFLENDSVSGTIPGEPGAGLGPTFNGNSCAMCHGQPTPGGSSPGLTSKQHSVPNPQVFLATLDGAQNVVPSFIMANGPVRVARFISDGGVHDLYTIQGRHDAQGCVLAQPDFATNLADNNVIFRIPTPLYGLGLVENTPDATLQASLAATQSARASLGIGGAFNTSGNDGTITRFGWKAQNKSLLMFSGEAYNVEMGVSNELFPNERSAVAGCVFNPTPEDSTNLQMTNGTASELSSDIVNFAGFMRLLAPPTPTTASPSEQNGRALFTSTGCALCHTQSLTTAASPTAVMSNVTYHPYSDFAIHHMGQNLADGITQGSAGPDQFRTAPLWGLGQRLYFLHDGRTSDLLQAIQDHASTCAVPAARPNGPPAAVSNCASEANAVIAAFNKLTVSQKQDLLNFLRSL